MRYLTKSRFKLALECVTKLHYTRKKDYADESIDDPFMEALAEGGFQVGELAKFLFLDDPVGEKITITAIDHEEALRETESRLSKPGRVVIAEAAFLHKSLFVRTDLIVRDGNVFNLYEVKSKSADEEESDFITKRGDPRISGDWVSYLYDVAFQKYVVSEGLHRQDHQVHAHLILVDKSKATTVDGLNQKFKLRKENGRKAVYLKPGLKKSDVDVSILKILNVDDVIERIWNEFQVPTDYETTIRFKDFVNLCADLYTNDKRQFAPLGKKCKDCQFINADPEANNLKSGFHECWKNKTHYSDELLKKSLALELWGGGTGNRSLVQNLIGGGTYLLENVNENDIAPNSKSKEHPGLSPHERRMEQVNRVKAGTTESYFDKKGLKKEMDTWVYPLHMIDFETTMTALPFHKGRHPYEGIAFQFSHHTIENDGTIRHAGQYLSFEPGVFPNYQFVRELKAQLENDKGSIFRYHNHENTYLRKIFEQLDTDKNSQLDKDMLQGFIQSITRWREEEETKKTMHQRERCMIDLYELVVRYYYSPYARGINSIKAILPAIIQESSFLRSKYGRPVYGKGKEVRSLNVDEHVWIDPKFGNDPYKTLPKVFGNYDERELDKLLFGFDDLADGGAAMAAYNYLQFTEVPNDQRERLREALLRYCELDTMAMVMIIEGWQHLE